MELSREGGHAMPNVLSHTTPEVFSPETGRVDALRLAEYLQLRTTDMAEITGYSGRYLRKDPDAPSFQETLKKTIFIINGLLDLTGDKRQVLIWLNAPHPALDNEAPLDLMRSNELDVVVDLVDDMLTGAPA
jgi:uncharacterized protein (DUF2384 family)